MSQLEIEFEKIFCSSEWMKDPRPRHTPSRETKPPHVDRSHRLRRYWDACDCASASPFSAASSFSRTRGEAGSGLSAHVPEIVIKKQVAKGSKHLRDSYNLVILFDNSPIFFGSPIEVRSFTKTALISYYPLGRQ